MRVIVQVYIYMYIYTYICLKQHWKRLIVFDQQWHVYDKTFVFKRRKKDEHIPINLQHIHILKNNKTEHLSLCFAERKHPDGHLGVKLRYIHIMVINNWMQNLTFQNGWQEQFDPVFICHYFRATFSMRKSKQSNYDLRSIVWKWQKKFCRFVDFCLCWWNHNLTQARCCFLLLHALSHRRNENLTTASILQFVSDDLKPSSVLRTLVSSRWTWKVGVMQVKWWLLRATH